MARVKLNFPVGANLEDETLFDELRDRLSELEGFLLDNLENLSMRAVCDDFHLNSIEKESEGRYALRYTYDWSAHYGCRDANDGGSEEGEIIFGYADGVVTFEKEVVPRRDTCDEF